MAIEKERKFLLKELPRGLPKPQNIKQAYLMLGDNNHLRVRIINNKEAYLTYKVIDSDTDRQEFEYRIPYFDGLTLYCSTNYQLEKDRYKTVFKGNLVDIDHYFHQNLMVAEIEYDNDLLDEDIPYYFGEEITGVKEYSNIYIAIKNG